MYKSKNFCAPTIKYENTCYSFNQLKHIADTYNKTHEDKIYSKTKQTLWKDLYVKFSHCHNEQCWSKQFNFESPFKPEFFEIKLDGNTISKVLNQFKYKNFEFLGVGPSDSYKNSIFKKYLKLPSNNFKKHAYIINLDEEHFKGSHWVCIFIDDNINYFDPLGDIPTINLEKFLLKIKLMFPNKFLIINNIKYQKNDQNCGFYVFKFIKNKLDGKNKMKINKKEFINN